MWGYQASNEAVFLWPHISSDPAHWVYIYSTGFIRDPSTFILLLYNVVNKKLPKSDCLGVSPEPDASIIKRNTLKGPKGEYLSIDDV